MGENKQLSATLMKNGIDYRMIKRSEKAVLWELFLKGERVGYEVSEIVFHPEEKKFGKIFPEREAISADSRFARFDGSRCFFPEDLKAATKCYEAISKYHRE